MKSVAGITCYVKELNKTAEFYESLGFQFKKGDQEQITIYLNWFRMDFLQASSERKPEFMKEANLPNKGSGLFLYISVDDVDEFYKEVLAKGLIPASEPRDWPWGNREFVIRDPDGYKLVFFKRNPEKVQKKAEKKPASKEPLYRDAKRMVIKHGKASAIFLQKKLMIDFERATSILEELEAEGVIGPASDAGLREVLIKA